MFNIDIDNGISKDMAKELLKSFDNFELQAGVFNAKYADGTEVKDVSNWQEYGTANIPARPFFRPVVENSVDKWGRLYTQMVLKTKDPELAMEQLGEVMKGDFIEKIMSIQTPPLSPKTIARKKSSKPLIETGLMRDSCDYKVIKK